MREAVPWVRVLAGERLCAADVLEVCRAVRDVSQCSYSLLKCLHCSKKLTTTL